MAATAIGQVLEHVGGRVLIDAHHPLAALLHRGKIGVLPSRTSSEEHHDASELA